jgi:hypothetical protein
LALFCSLAQTWLTEHQDELRQRALAIWQKNPRLDILGRTDAQIFPSGVQIERRSCASLVFHPTIE